MKKEPRTKRFLNYIIAHPGTTAAEMARALNFVQYKPIKRAHDPTKPAPRPEVDGTAVFNTTQRLQKQGLIRKVKVGTKVRLYPTLVEVERMHEETDYDL